MCRLPGGAKLHAGFGIDCDSDCASSWFVRMFSRHASFSRSCWQRWPQVRPLARSLPCALRCLLSAGVCDGHCKRLWQRFEIWTFGCSKWRTTGWRWRTGCLGWYREGPAAGNGGSSSCQHHRDQAEPSSFNLLRPICNWEEAPALLAIFGSDWQIQEMLVLGSNHGKWIEHSTQVWHVEDVYDFCRLCGGPAIHAQTRIAHGLSCRGCNVDNLWSLQQKILLGSAVLREKVPGFMQSMQGVCSLQKYSCSAVWLYNDSLGTSFSLNSLWIRSCSETTEF